MIKDEDISLLTQAQHVQTRPTQFLGSIIPETTTIPYFVDGKILKKEITYTPSCIRCVNEILENSCDEFLRSKIKNPKLYISFNTSTNEIIIKDNGSGVPIGTHKTGLPTPQVVFGFLGSGSNFESDKQAGLQGQNGVGAACVNFCSEYFEITINRDNNTYTQLFEQGTNIINEPLIVSNKNNESGTQIKFKLNQNIFPVIIPSEWLEVKSEELSNTIPNLTVNLTIISGVDVKTIEYTHNPLKRVKNEIQHVLTDDKCKITFIYKKDEIGIYSWINGGYLFDGGSCTNDLEKIFVNNVLMFLEQQIKKEKLKISKEDILQDVILLCEILVSDPLYDSQAKTRFKGPSQRSVIDKCCSTISKFFKNNPEYINNVLERARAKTNNRAKKIIEKKHKIQFIEGYLKATSKDKSLTWLLLTEGLSAASQVSAARDPQIIGTLPLGGKMNNIYNCTPAQLLAMPKIVDLMQIIGLVPGKKAVRSELNYNHVVIATDADPDGDGIFVNLVNLFYSQWPELLQDTNEPFLYRLCAPNIVVVTSSERIHFTTRAEYEKNKNKIKSKFQIEYMKGLGSMTISDWKYCLNNLNNLQPIISDEKFSYWLEVFFSPDSNKRKEWLTQCRHQ